MSTLIFRARNSNKILLRIFMVLVLISLSIFMALAQSAYAVPPTVGAGMSAETNAVTPITDLNINGTGSSPTVVNISVTYGALVLPATAGVTYNGGISTGQNITMSGTITAVNTALDGATYQSNSVGTYTLYLSVLPEVQAFEPITKHMYTYSDAKRTWGAANAFAGTQTLLGATGYMVTITSELEDQVAKRLVNGDFDGGWIGANDLETLGVWKWEAGPEDGNVITANNGYQAWAPGEPRTVGNPPVKTCAYLQTDEGGLNPVWANDLCSPAIAFRHGVVIEYDVASQIEQASKTITVANGVTPEPEPPQSRDVSSCAELQTIDDDPSNHGDTYNLTQDISCDGFNVTPLNWGQDSFDGIFDGQGYTISDLNISVDDNAGLFYILDGATIRNLNLVGGSVENTYCDGALASPEDYSAGAIAPLAYDTNLINITSNLAVTSACGPAGGLAGIFDVLTEDVTVRRVSSTGNVSGAWFAGGLFGRVESTDQDVLIEQSFATGDVVNDFDDAGGLIGQLNVYSDASPANVTIQDVYAWGDASADGYTDAGGLIGYAYTFPTNSDPATILIQNAYATGATLATEDVGGLIGYVDLVYDGSDITIKNVFATGQVTATDDVDDGAIAGFHDTSDPESKLTTDGGVFYDATRTGIDRCASDDELVDCTAINVAPGDNESDYFFGNSTNEPMASWNFGAIWITNVGDYPTFADLPEAPVGDNDGIAAAIENGAPNNGDGNNDGVLDSLQSNVASFINGVTGKYVTLAVSGSCLLEAVGVAKEETKPSQDKVFAYPAGLLNFRAVACGAPGVTVTVTQINFEMSGATKDFVARKYTSYNDKYQTLDGASVTNETIGGKSAVKMMFSMQDGGAFDDDQNANGTIVDPAGLGAVAANGVLSNTGANSTQFVIVGLMLLIAGGIITFAFRRRNLPPCSVS